MSKAYTFDSGLLLLYTKNDINKSTEIDISFDCGSRCDGDLFGLAHFCEHMFFSGTDKLSRQEVSKRYFDLIQSNAFTNEDEIVFTGQVLTEKAKTYLQVVQDMICNSTFTPKAVEEEKKVVIQEIARGNADERAKSYRFNRYELYGKEYCKIGVAGTEDSVNRITSKDVKKYVRKYFVKNNCTITICSPLSFGKVKKLVHRHFESKMPARSLTPLPYKSDAVTFEEKVSLHTKDIGKNFFSIYFINQKHGPDLRYGRVLGAMSSMIGDISYGLEKELRMDHNLVYSLDVNHNINKCQAFISMLSDITTENIKPCLDVIIDYLKKIRQTGFSEQSLKQALTRNRYYYETGINSPGYYNHIARRYRYFDRFVSDKERHQVGMSLTLQEVNEAFNEFFSNCKLHVVIYGDATKKDIYTIKQIKKKWEAKYVEK